MDGDENMIEITPEMLELLRRPAVTRAALFSACFCGKLLKVEEWARKWYSGSRAEDGAVKFGVNYIDLLCGDCRKEFKGFPRLVCLGCRELVAFIKPGKEPTGFVFEPGRHYHVVSCPKCDNDVRSSQVLEHENFCRANRIPTKTNHDLLQEIEQKILQGRRAAAIIRERYEASKQQR
jgi:hypothetical protein